MVFILLISLLFSSSCSGLMIAHVIKLITNINAFTVDIVDVDDGFFGAVVQVVPLLSLGRWSSDDALAQKRGCSSMKPTHKQNERLFISSSTTKKKCLF